MTLALKTWDARIDAALALFIGAAIVGLLTFSGLAGSAAEAARNLSYVLFALSLATFAWAGIRATVRRARA